MFVCQLWAVKALMNTSQDQGATKTLINFIVSHMQAVVLVEAAACLMG